jgi:hypothetical protein
MSQENVERHRLANEAHLEDVFGAEIRVVPEAFFELGEYTITFHVLEGRGQRSGADVTTPAAHLCKWRDGLIVYFKGYVRRTDVFSDLGVSEDALEPIAP